MCLGQRAVLLLQLRKQPHVFDRDDGLVREGLEKSDLFVGKGIDLYSSYRHHADAGAPSHERHGENRLEADLASEFPTLREVLRLGDVVHVDRFAVQDGAPADEASREGHVAARCDYRNRPVVGDQTESFGLEEVNASVVRATDTRGVRHDDVEHWLEVTGVATHGPEDLRRRRLLIQGFGRDTLQVRIGRRWLGTASEPQEGSAALLAELRPGRIFVLALGTRHARGLPEAGVGERSEPWAETNRPGLTWSRTRSQGSRLGTARSRHPRRSVVRALTATPRQLLVFVFWP